MRFSLSELAAVTDGRVVGPDGSADAEIDGVSIDSRTVAPGQLFVPLVAERDGHEFIEAAVARGAAASLTSQVDDQGRAGVSAAPSIVVSDTGDALTNIGIAARARLACPVVGITGSVGKTSVKDLTRAAAGSAAWASAASFNNELGVPLTLANAPEETSVAVVEMGARGIGHIRELCAVARPTIGVVTCVALVHSELFGSIDAVAQGKGELIEAVPADGYAVLNADDATVLAMADRTDATVVTYGSVRADVRFGPVTLDDQLRPTFTVDSPWGKAELTLQVRGAHMAGNAAAALAAAASAGVSFDQAVAGLLGAKLSNWRMEVTTAADGLTVVNDAYNANPTSMRAALSALRSLNAGSAVAVLGAMAELGEEGPEEHLAIADEATGNGIRVVAVNAPEYGPGVEHVDGLDQAFQLLSGVDSTAAVLVKGSRVAGLEELADRLLAR